MLKTGKRSPWIPLDPAITKEDEAGARACAKTVSDTARNLGFVPEGVKETVAEYAKGWLKHREERGLASVSDDRARLTNHVFPVIGGRDIRKIDRADLLDLVDRLDRRVRAGEIGWKTAAHSWGLVRAMFRDACGSKRKELRIRDDNPAENVAGPDVGARKAKVYLWPSEFLALVTCVMVPLRWRRLFALAVYTYARAGEVEALAWDDVDLERGVMHLHQSVDRVRKRGKVKATKTGIARKVPIEPALLPLLQSLWREGEKTGRVFRMPSAGVLSRKLKFYLKKAGVKRGDLFANDATRKAITFHDLRATGITWCAVRGDDPLKIMQRAGHADFQTTQIYIREAENLGEAFGAVFPELPDLSRPRLVRARRNSAKILPNDRIDGTKQPKTSPIEWSRRGSKPGSESPGNLGGSETSEAAQNGGRDENTRADPESRPSAFRSSSFVQGEAQSEAKAGGRSSERGPAATTATPDEGPRVSDAALERAIVEAMLHGAVDVAKVLSAQLQDRRRERAGNVIELIPRRP